MSAPGKLVAKFRPRRQSHICEMPRCRAVLSGVCQRTEAMAMNADSIQYALETDWPVGAAGFEPLHLGICIPLAPVL